ncbi:hypothetical protein JCM8208_001554 [Rhodotorula glutinis]
MQETHLLCLFLCFSLVSALWPKPHAIERGSSFVRLGASFSVDFWPRNGQEPAARDLRVALNRARRHLDSDLLQRLTVDRGEQDRHAVNAAAILERLEVRLASSRPHETLFGQLGEPLDEIDESYILDVPSQYETGAPLVATLVATLAANTTLGLVRGLDTFTQLVYALPAGPEDLYTARYIPQAPVHIVDRPAFPHRCARRPLSPPRLDSDAPFVQGVHARHVPQLLPCRGCVCLAPCRPTLALTRRSRPDILRTLDIMASVKLNVFHWHVVDSQSWPLEIPSFPDLADLGAFSRDEIYREKDVKRVVDFAASLGIAVLLEVDMPGHTASVSAAFPDYVACLDARPWSTYAAEPPAGQLKLGDPDVLAFSRRVLRHATSSSSSRLFSTGGDEVNERCYLDDPATAAVLVAQNLTVDELLAEFVNGIHDAVRESGKEPVVWEEMVLKHELDLGRDVVVMVWINSSNVRAVADKGYRIIHAASDFFYLDCGAGSWLGNSPNATSWCDPYKSWQKSYSFNPYLDLDSAHHHLVLGGEALVWSEQASPANLDSISWPRAAAAAEVFWTGGAVVHGQRDLGDALPRLHDWRYRAVQRGVRATPLQPHWCALRPGACDLEA